MAKSDDEHSGCVPPGEWVAKWERREGKETPIGGALSVEKEGESKSS